MKIVALAGGVGGAKLVHGLAQILPPENLTIIVNTGDDFLHLGLKICPDLDTVCYTLAGFANPETGWGIAHDTWNAINSIENLGGPGWFRIGDIDFGTHLERTRRMLDGQSLSEVTKIFCEAWNVKNLVLPMSDDPVETIVLSNLGDLPFQEYFVHRHCEPEVKGFIFKGCDDALPAPGIINSIQEADLLIVCPSNPWVSIDPILSIPTFKETVLDCKKEGLRVLAVSPIVAGRAVKGPVVKMYREMGVEPSAFSVAKHYHNFIDQFVFDLQDQSLVERLRGLQIDLLCVNTIMKSKNDRKKLAKEILSNSDI